MVACAIWLYIWSIRDSPFECWAKKDEHKQRNCNVKITKNRKKKNKYSHFRYTTNNQMYKYTRIFEKVSDERKSKNIVRKEKRQSTRKQYTVNCFLYWFTIRMFRMPFVPNIVFFPFYSFLVNFSQRLYVFSVVFFLFCIKSVVVCVWLRCCVQRWMRRIFFFLFFLFVLFIIL